MPHAIVEYSANLDAQLRIDDLLQVVHKAALETGVFPMGGLRTRAAPRRHYLIADADPDNAFVHVTLKIGHGRDLVTKQTAGQQVFDAVCEHLQPLFEKQPLAISFEVIEIDRDLNFKHNNIHQYLESRTSNKAQ